MSGAAQTCSDVVKQADNWFKGLLSSSSRSQVMNHLSSCRGCTAHFQEISLFRDLMVHLHPVEAAGEPPSELPRVLQECESQWNSYKKHSEFLDRVTGLPDEQLGVVFRNDPRIEMESALQMMLDEALFLSRRNPKRSLQVGTVAVKLSDHIDAGAGDTARTSQIRALTQLAYLQRHSSDLTGAEENFKTVARLLRDANLTGTRLWAEYHRQLGCQRSSQRRFGEAEAHLNAAISCFRKLGLTREQGVATLNKGTLLGEAGNPSESVAVLQQGLAILEDQPFSILHLVSGKHNILMALIDLGNLNDARELLPEVRVLHTELSEPVPELRLQWVESQLALACKDFRLAEELLLAVTAGFVDFDMPYDVALASLHLAVLYMEEGRWSEIPPLISEMLTVFQALRIDREAIAAVMILKRAMEVERLSLRLLREAVTYFQRAQADPGMRFQPSSR